MTSAVPLPLPTSTPLLTDPVSVVTSAVPLPSVSPLPSLSVSCLRAATAADRLLSGHRASGR